MIALALPVAALAGTLITRDWQGLKQGAFSAAATAGVTLLLKYTVKEERPDRSDWHSFPSGHSAVSFATAAYLQRRYGWKFGALLLTLWPLMWPGGASFPRSTIGGTLWREPP